MNRLIPVTTHYPENPRSKAWPWVVFMDPETALFAVVQVDPEQRQFRYKRVVHELNDATLRVVARWAPPSAFDHDPAFTPQQVKHALFAADYLRQ